jgi:hypothetical protein
VAQPRPGVAPGVDREPMHSSIGPCHNIGSCGQLISAGTVKQAIGASSPGCCIDGQASHRGAEFARGLIANGLRGSVVIYWRQAKQIPSADAFSLKQSPSSVNQ